MNYGNFIARFTDAHTLVNNINVLFNYLKINLIFCNHPHCIFNLICMCVPLHLV